MLRFPLSPKQNYTALCLNYKLPKFFDSLWNAASLRVAADGGSNRIHKNFHEKNYKVPHLVAGDFDSLKENVRKYMEENGTKFIKIYNQDLCDVKKAMLVIKEHNHYDPILIMGGYGGRFDHTIAAISAALWMDKIPIWMLDNNNLMTWIRPRDKGVIIPKAWTTRKCSLTSLSRAIKHIKTKGLKFDLDGPLELGKAISISNTMLRDDIKVKTTDPVLFITEIPQERLISALE